MDTSESEVFLGALTVVGRADPGGPVDRVTVWQGRWAAAPGEIVLNRRRERSAGRASVPGSPFRDDPR